MYITTNVHNGQQDPYFVATVYDKYWYVGRVTDVEENEVMINVMCRACKYERMLLNGLPRRTRYGSTKRKF